MNHVVWSDVQVDVAVNLRLLRAILTVTARAEATVHRTLEAGNDDWDCLCDHRHEGVNCHSLDDVVADKGVPAGRVVPELPVEELASVWIDLLEIRVD